MQHPALTGAQHVKLSCVTYEAELYASCWSPAVYGPLTGSEKAQVLISNIKSTQARFMC